MKSIQSMQYIGVFVLIIGIGIMGEAKRTKFIHSLHISECDGKIPFDSLSLKRLLLIPGIDSSLARRILESSHDSIKDLLKIKGIGPKKLKILERYLCRKKY